jgi:hypothetical protein
MIAVSQQPDLRRVPRIWVGMFLLAIFWPLNWLLPDETRRTSYLFFPLWLGYILIVDGCVLLRTGSSMLTRSRCDFVLTFVCSAPVWWLFEVINWRTRNWEYLGGEVFTGPQHFVLSTVAFSTVMPAVFETAEWICSWRPLAAAVVGPAIKPIWQLLAVLATAGLTMLALTFLWPRVFYPFVWGAIVLILEPLNKLLGRRTFFDWLQYGNWRPVLALSAGALVCGFFWEMWNYFSYPKWVYHTPGAQFLRVFEMPLLGYIGYLPFAWELYALRNFLWPGAPQLNL